MNRGIVVSMQNNVDVLINVFGKPHQTALSLLSLLQHSGRHVGLIYFQEEPATAEYERKGQEKLIRFLGDRLVHFMPKYWNGIDPTDEGRLRTDGEYLLSMRYQHGWERSEARYALTIHNDIEVHGDIVGHLLEAIGDYSGAGEIGQCWWCPAGQNNLCDSTRYAEFTPSYPYLMKIYNKNFDPAGRRAYHLGLSQQFQDRPWPLPECRLNEWCALIDLEKVRPDTMPFGSGTPFGALIPSGALIGENRDRPVCLDTGVQWFRDMNQLGHRFVHHDIYRDIDHDRLGNVALDSPEMYVEKELAAMHRIKAEYPDFYRFLMS
ncbi:hypothetical protein [Pseudodesulfovibrio indicus]|uniref:hypothetical protein n=1 Tax=Pseudodesulfovibrio indicus TaxID=1716143 RepID=UPI0029319F00|nr:hypothetical protein [Pseudodesulfovibrio indicus]